MAIRRPQPDLLAKGPATAEELTLLRAGELREIADELVVFNDPSVTTSASELQELTTTGRLKRDESGAIELDAQGKPIVLERPIPVPALRSLDHVHAALEARRHHEEAELAAEAGEAGFKAQSYDGTAWKEEA
jgi:hypothetical protein